MKHRLVIKMKNIFVDLDKHYSQDIASLIKKWKENRVFYAL